MGHVVGTAVRFPTVLLTSALVVLLAFWLLVLLGRAGVRDFDADAPSLARSLNGMPVAVAASVAIPGAWLVSLSGMVLVALAGLTGPGGAVARVVLLVVSVLAAWAVARRCAAPLSRLFLDRAGPHRRAAASGAPYDPGSPRTCG
ncbi:hypothetical protein [Streptomyces sp. NPDC096132]|uniref:hypothetical protein n=1 Tax=Streptomyces sp. NPDC096132 TaxID=3366075 RepID=UPI0037F971D9